LAKLIHSSGAATRQTAGTKRQEQSDNWRNTVKNCFCVCASTKNETSVRRQIWKASHWKVMKIPIANSPKINPSLRTSESLYAIIPQF
jgi:hypothetical protein